MFHPARRPWYRSTWFTVVALLLVFPVGLLLMWTRHPGWGKRWNWAVTGLVTAAVVLAVATTPNKSTTKTAAGPRPATSRAATSTPITPAPTPAPTAQPTSQPTPPSSVAVTVPPPPLVAITGFGATTADWNANHVADNEFASGSVYNPDPCLPTINGHTGAR